MQKNTELEPVPPTKLRINEAVIYAGSFRRVLAVTEKGERVVADDNDNLVIEPKYGAWPTVGRYEKRWLFWKLITSE